MWRLLKAELRYRKLFFIGWLFLVMLLMLMVVGRSDPGKYHSLAVMIFGVWISLNFFWDEKRIRLYTLLPIPAAKLGLARVLKWHLVHFSAILFFSSQLLLKHDMAQNLESWRLLTLSSVTLILFVSLPFFYHDITHGGIKSYRDLTRALIIVCEILVFVLWFFLAHGHVDGHRITAWLLSPKELPIFPILNVLFVPVLFHASVIIFTRRQSYLK